MQIFMIIMREMLEIFLLLGILFSQNQKVAIKHGIVLGTLLSLLLGSSAIYFEQFLASYATELINAIILSLTSILLIVTITSTSHRQIRAKLAQSGSNKALIMAVALIILREGAEIVGFCYSFWLSGQIGLPDLLWQFGLSIIASIMILCLFYLLGARRYTYKFMHISRYLIMFIAAGLAAQAANFFIAAGVLPPLISEVWNLSWFINIDGNIHQFLAILFGYTHNPTGLELLFYGTTIYLFVLMQTPMQTNKLVQ